MKKSKFSDTERLAILAKVDSGTGTDEVCREYQITMATLHKWRKEQADLQDETKRQLKQLELENARLKKLYADLSMSHTVLQKGYAILKKAASPRQQEEIIDYIHSVKAYSIRHCSKVLGFRRQTYYHRKQGFRSEHKDDELKMALKEATRQFGTWGFWKVFYYLRNQGHAWNHKRVYRVWMELGLNLRKGPKREKIRRETWE